MVADEAYATCFRLARDHYENFPVASWLLPRRVRPHVAAIYAFARTADDFADEGAGPDEDRLARLDHWRDRLLRAAAGRVSSDGDRETTAIFTALAQTIAACRLDVGWLSDLLDAFCQDVRVKRYDTWDAVIAYCSRSANPVGRLVLAVCGYRDRRTAEWADAVCTALQLANFWQDLAIDWRKGRLYLPLAIVDAHGAREADLDCGVVTPAWRAALGDVAARTRALFDAGRPVADAVTGRLRLELRATWLGGVRVLDRLELADFDVFNRRPSLGWRDGLPIAWGMARWNAASRGTKDRRRGRRGGPAGDAVRGAAGTKSPGKG